MTTGPILYKRVSEGLNKYKLIPYDASYPETLDKFVSKEDKDYYESIYCYTEEHKAHFDKNKTVSGLTGLVTDKVAFDFDAPDLEEARRDTLTLLTRLEEQKIDPRAVRVFFSGKKGFHVEVHTEELLQKPEVDAIVDNLAADLPSLDSKIRDEQRLLRLPLTKHQVSGLYKIPISHPYKTLEKLNVSLASTPDMVAKQWDGLNKQLGSYARIKKFSDSLKEAPVSFEEPAVETFEGPVPEIDFSRRPKHISPAKFALLQGHFDEGERNHACMILASTFKGLGYPKEITYNMLKATLRLRQQRMRLKDYDRDELWKTIVGVVYSPNWRGGTYSEAEDRLIKKVIAQFKLGQDEYLEDKKVVTLPEVNELFKNFAQNIDKNTIKIGIPSIDEKIRITTSTLVCLLAAPSAGKSSISFGILNSVSNNNVPCMFFSLDMATPLVYQRLIQRHFGYQSDEIFDIFKKDDRKKIDAISEKLQEEYKNVKFCFKSGITVETIRELIIKEKELTGEYPKLICIDYLECINSGISDPTAAKAFVASALKDIANDFGVCVFLLVQPRKSEGPADELNSYRAIKGSSVIEECASQIFTIHRPGFNPQNPENDRFLNITVVKNRMGQLGSFDYGWQGLTGAIHELSSEEYHDLKELKENNAQAKNDKQGRSLF